METNELQNRLVSIAVVGLAPHLWCRVVWLLMKEHLHLISSHLISSLEMSHWNKSGEMVQTAKFTLRSTRPPTSSEIGHQEEDLLLLLLLLLLL